MAFASSINSSDMANETNQTSAQRDELNHLIAERNQRMRQIEKLYEEIRSLDQQVVILRKGSSPAAPVAQPAKSGTAAPPQRPGEAA